MQNMPIAIFRGDDTDALGYQTIVGTIRTDLDLTGCRAVFKYLSFSVEFDPIPEDKKLTVIIPSSETSKFPPGLGYASLRVYDAEGKLCTFSNRIMVFVATKTPMFGNAEFEVDFNVRPELEPLKIFVGPNPDDFDEYRGFLKKVIDRASAEKYGLAMLLDAIDSDLGADDGVAATPVAVKAAYAAIIKKLTDDYYTAEQTEEAIDRVAAYYITYDAAGNPFPTYASLANAQTVYSGGQVRTPTRNDYCVVLADETHQGAEYRYIYAVAEGQTTGSWQPQFPVEGVMTVDQDVVKGSQNPVSGGGVWSMLWGALAALPTGFTSLYDWVVGQLGYKRDLTDMSCTAEIAGIPQIGSGTFVVSSPSGTSTTLTPFDSSGVIGWGWYMTYPYIYARASNSYDIIFGTGISDMIPLDMTAKTQAVTYNGETWTVAAFTGETANTRLANMTDIPAASTSTPAMDGTGSAGSSAAFARGDHVHPTDTSRVPTSRTVNGKALSSNVTLTGADIAVSGTDATKISAALANKASTADATLTERGYSEWTCDPATITYQGQSLLVEVKPSGDKWTIYIGGGTFSPEFGNGDTTEYSYTGTGPNGTTTVTATRTALSGYVLGSQTDKPLASEAEAEALRQGKANRAANPTAGNLAALDANGNPTDSGIAAGDLLTIVTLADSTETMASILARLNAINAAHKHVFFDCSGIDVNPRLYLCTIMIDADANAVRVYDQVTGKLYIGPYDATETIGEVFAKAVDAYHSITVSAVTLDGVTVTGQTVTIREGTDATAPVYATATITDGAPVTFVVPKGMIYFLEITDTLADHFGPRVTSGARQGIATADAAVTFTYYDAEHIDVSEITTFAKLQEALTWFGTNEVAARNNLVGIEIADTWASTNGTVYDNPRVVWDVHYFEDENGVSHLGALMGTKYCSYNDVQFDAAEGEECDSSTETVAEADVYYYGLASGETSKTAANLTLLELSTGDTLPYADYAKIYKSAIRDTTRNSLQYGYNNWRDSAYRQYLNSDAATGQWWGATHIGDVAPSQLNSVRGFMAGCSAALLAAAKKVKVATWPNYITDGPDQITTLYETLDTFFLPSGSEVYGDVNRNGGASVEGGLSPYWQARTGYTAPNNTAISTRIIYRELPVGSTASRAAANVRLRSAHRGGSGNVWNVRTGGQVGNNVGAGSAYASVPACVIY